MEDVLAKIVAHKREEIAQAIQQRPAEQLQEALAEAPAVRDFVGSLRARQGISLIAEIKRASPSAGLIRESFHPVELAQIYEQNGAGCLSVLTDEHFFQGHLDHLRQVRQAVSIPILRKDFILDRYQVLEARSAGADCILLIAECLDDCRLRDLYFYASELGMESLIEVYEEENLDRVLKLEPTLVGINNRNLRTFQTDLQHSSQMAQSVSGECLLVSESGIRSREDMLLLERAGFGAALIGETLMRADNIGGKLRELLGQ